ncbi:Protein ssh4 [Coemansia sp. Benny D160-2]|nr:Protein ssh4 [Coemansia sp. Benny D160-2]
MTALATAVVAAICVCIVMVGIGVVVRMYVIQSRPMTCAFPTLRRKHRRGRKYAQQEERAKKNEEVLQLSLDETLARLDGTRAKQNYVYACEYTAVHFIDESEGGLHATDTEFVVEHGASAWEFVPAHENAGAAVHNRTEVEFAGGEHSLIANMQIPNAQRVYYYEVRLDSLPEGTGVALGVAMRSYPPLRMAGWARNSVAFHTADGCVYHNHPLDVSQKIESSLRTSDTLGVGWRPNSGKMFFTINGVIVCHLRTPWAHKRMYPIVSADGPCRLNVNFGARAFVLAHANMRHWALAPPEGARPPPPLYQNVSETVLLAAHSDSLDGYLQNDTPFPPSYHDTNAHPHHPPLVRTASNLSLVDDTFGVSAADDLDSSHSWSRYSAVATSDSSRDAILGRVHSSPDLLHHHMHSPPSETHIDMSALFSEAPDHTTGSSSYCERSRRLSDCV